MTFTGSGNWDKTSLLRGCLETCLPQMVRDRREEDSLDTAESYVLNIVTTVKKMDICKIRNRMNVMG